MIKLVLLRHGESVWNKENRFTGWTDVALSEKGEKEAKEAARVLKKEGYEFDIAFCSILKRAKDTLSILQKEMKDSSYPIEYSYRLNERHYGSLQGLNKSEMTQKYGEDQVKKWRRGFAIRPPALKISDPRFPGNDPLYKGIPKKELPLTESLKDTIARVIPYWKEKIAPLIKKEKKVLISAHGNTLRALIKHLDAVPENQITELNVPTGVPLIYEINEKTLKPIRHYYLGDQKEIEKKIASVSNQAKAKK